MQTCGAAQATGGTRCNVRAVLDIRLQYHVSSSIMFRSSVLEQLESGNEAGWGLKS